MVCQWQLRLSGNRSVVDTEASLASQITELEDRVARLHRLGSQYAHIRISEHVERLHEAAVAAGCRGRRVATEV